MDNVSKSKAYYHLPGLFEFYELYRVFLPLFREHREYFYDWCEIGSIYGAPADCLWGGGRVGFGDNDPGEVLALMREYKISARLTFSNSLLRNEHLSDKKCNHLCELFSENSGVQNGVIRKLCYENVSRRNLGENCPVHHCKSPGAAEGYLFSKAMRNPGFIGTNDIQDIYLPMGFSNFKIEGRSLGSAIVLEFLLYYMTKPEYHINVREKIYLDSMLDLF